MMKQRYVCDIFKAFWAALGFLVFFCLLCACIVNKNYIFIVIYLVLIVVYARMALKNMSCIHVDDDKVEKRMLGKTVMSFQWDDIKEVGLLNNRFIYFSKEVLTDDDRYRMYFNWPPEDKIYFRAGEKATKFVERQWNRREKLFVRHKASKFQ